MTELGATPAVGAASVPPQMSVERYFEILPLLEYHPFAANYPRDKTLRAFRAKVPQRSRLILAAPVDALASDREAAERGRDALAKAIELLTPDTVLLPSPIDFGTGQRERDRLAEVAGALPDGLAVVWSAGPQWPVPLSVAVAGERGVNLAIDPLSSDPMEEIPAALATCADRGDLYLRLEHIGHRRHRIGRGGLEQVADLMDAFDDVTVVIAHAEGTRDARALLKLVGELADEG